jgi:predicted CxxxxCH...CXXCH cytochrome family protein
VPTANHGDGNIDVLAALGYPQNVAKHAVGTYTGNCTTAYCHSAGTSLTAPTYAPIAWGATATCASCHTGGTASGPTYTSGTPKANSHAVHVVSSAITCNVCHNDVTTTGTTITNAANHANSVYNIQPSSAQYTITTTGTPTTPTVCGTITCHGNGNATWGGVVQCQGCHMNTSSDVNDFALTPTAFWTNGTTSTINSTEWTSAGHGRTTAYASGNPAAGFTVANACLYCHDTTVAHKTAANPFRLRNFADATWGKNGNCQSCHAAGSAGITVDAVLKNSTSKVDSTHYGAKHSTTASGGQFCWDCHDPHGDSNVFMVHATVARTSDATTGAPTATVATTFTTFATGTDYAKSATPFNGICNVCHTTAGHYTATAGDGHNSATRCTTCHAHSSASDKNAAFGASGDCVGCHNTTQPITKGPLAGTGSRRAVAAEFANTWSHKRSAGGTVTKEDCIVCHMEGNMADGSTTAVHMDGLIQLRDPDTGLTIKGVTWGGTGAGAYTSTTVDAAPARFSRNLASTTIEPDTAAIMVNHCLKCHDNDGALSTTARVPGGTAEKPFNTTIAGTGYTGAGVTANGVLGGVTDIKASFATTNSSYHPVLGKQNNSYAYNTRMKAPYNTGVTKTAGTNTGWGHLMTCWDCHAPSGTASTVTLTSTVTAHGGATTIRGTATVTGTPSATNAVTLCVLCHAGYDTNTTAAHGTGSAFSTDTGRSEKTPYTRYGCNMCHSTNYATAVARPTRGADSHGFNTNWTYTGYTANRQYAFIRNTTALRSHTPLSPVGGTAARTCVGMVCAGSTSIRTEVYSPGGAY